VCWQQRTPFELKQEEKTPGDMKKKLTIVVVLVLAAAALISFSSGSDSNPYTTSYYRHINELREGQQLLLTAIEGSDPGREADRQRIGAMLKACRYQMKQADFWLRYLEPVSYKKINGPLPVEWETEVFEKFEPPYRRDGAGLTLAYQYLEETELNRDTLARLIRSSLEGIRAYTADSITRNLEDYHHFFLCNRLFLLNLAALYTTGFECPDTGQVLPELRMMLSGVSGIYAVFNESFPATALTTDYLDLYDRTKAFAARPVAYNDFDHYTFIRDYVNPLYGLNQEMIRQYQVHSRSMVDYSLNKQANSIFDKAVYNGSSPRGIFLRVKDAADLAEIDRVGKLLFYDPLLSGNNLRSCASCHKPEAYFTDNVTATALQFSRKDFLPRNTPSLVNAVYNHLIMLDGSHITLQNQTRGVMTNPEEMGGKEEEILRKVLSCATYKSAFSRLLRYTPQEPEITMDHIISALTTYYGKFSNYYAPFDEAMNEGKSLDEAARRGFNLFMGKAQCGTCHFVPQFNGVKPPYIGSEFEVLGVPADSGYRQLSPDKGRYQVNPAKETLHAFRTGTVRNVAHTAPYMHNGVFNTLEQVIDFYDAGGGQGKGLTVDNQTLSAEPLHLTAQEKKELIAFMRSLDEKILLEKPPQKLPLSKDRRLNSRKVGGVY
jgi:cytochrome c peroxidase